MTTDLTHSENWLILSYTDIRGFEEKRIEGVGGEVEFYDKNGYTTHFSRKKKNIQLSTLPGKRTRERENDSFDSVRD